MQQQRIGDDDPIVDRESVNTSKERESKDFHWFITSKKVVDKGLDDSGVHMGGADYDICVVFPKEKIDEVK